MNNSNRGLYSHGARPLEFIPYESGTTKSIDIPRESMLKRIVLQFTGSVTTVGETIAGAVLEDAVLRLIESIEIVGNGVADRVITDARGLYHLNTVMRGVAPAILNPTAVAAETYDISCFLELNLANKWGVNPADSLLRTTEFTSLKLRVRWAAPTALFSSAFDGAATIATTSGIQPVMYETLSIAPVVTRMMDYQEIEVTSATTGLEIDLPLQRMYQGVFFMATVAGARSDAVISDISFKTAQTLRQWDRVPYSIIRNEYAAKAGLSSMPTGCALALLTEDGMITSGLNAYRTNTAKCILNVAKPTGTVKIRMYHDSFLL